MAALLPSALILSLILAANLAARWRVGANFWLLLAPVPAYCALLALDYFQHTTSPPWGASVAGAILLATAGAAAIVLAPQARAQLARLLPIDPESPVHTTALVLSIVMVGTQVGSQFATDLLAQTTSGAQLQPIDLLVNELPFLLAAFLGVGIFVRRSPAEATIRLGLVKPTVWQIVLALAAAGAFYAFGNGMDALDTRLLPSVSGQVTAANNHLFGQLDNPLGIATIALSAGICEEALFRGALQPRLSILWTSIVFAAVHTQYGLSLDTLAVIILASGLGMLRRITNTTTSTVCHVVYNTLVGVGVGGTWLLPALVTEAALLLAGFAAFFTGRLGALPTAHQDLGAEP